MTIFNSKLILFLPLFFSITIAPVIASESDIVIAVPGQNVTVWKGFNVTGKIFIKFDGGTGEDCAKLWWIKMGINSDLGTHCDRAEIKFNLPLIYGELRAGHFKRKTAISVSDNAKVSYSQELCGKIIDCD